MKRSEVDAQRPLMKSETAESQGAPPNLANRVIIDYLFLKQQKSLNTSMTIFQSGDTGTPQKLLPFYADPVIQSLNWISFLSRMCISNHIRLVQPVFLRHGNGVIYIVLAPKHFRNTRISMSPSKQTS